MSDRVKQFKDHREWLNEKILARDDVNIKRFFALDGAVYRDGALDVKTKELLGLVASFVLRCDDCIAYHLMQAKEAGVNDKEFNEVMSIGLIAGGSITIPHIRRATEFWEEMNS